MSVAAVVVQVAGYLDVAGGVGEGFDVVLVGFQLAYLVGDGPP